LSVKVATGPEQGLKPVVDRSFKTVGEAFRCEESGERFSKIAVEL
jgi:hypothetical protein